MTTLPEEWSEESGSEHGAEFEPNVAESEYPAVVPVRVVFSETENLPPEFASFMTWPVGQVNVSAPTQIIQRRYKRFKAQLMISIPAAGTVTINSKFEPLSKDASPQGWSYTFTAANNNPGFLLPPYESQQPLWAIASIAGVTIAVLDQSYGQVQ